MCVNVHVDVILAEKIVSCIVGFIQVYSNTAGFPCLCNLVCVDSWNVSFYTHRNQWTQNLEQAKYLLLTICKLQMY